MDQPQRTQRTQRPTSEKVVPFSALSAFFVVNKSSMKDIKALSDQIRQISYAIHVYHGHGHLEKVYENALAHRLKKLGLEVQQQYPLTVHDEDGTVIGEYFAD